MSFTSKVGLEIPVLHSFQNSITKMGVSPSPLRNQEDFDALYNVLLALFVFLSAFKGTPENDQKNYIPEYLSLLKIHLFFLFLTRRVLLDLPTLPSLVIPP